MALDEDRWLDAEFGKWWVLYHAFTILCLAGQPAHLDTALKALKYANEYEYDWIPEIAPAALEQFGPAGVERLIQFVNEERPLKSKRRNTNFYSALDHIYAQHGVEHYFDGGDTTHWRSEVCAGLARIGRAYPGERERISDFLCSRFTDPAETEQTFLGFIVDDVMLLDRESALEPLRLAFERKAVDITFSNGFEETLKFFDSHDAADALEFKSQLMSFYEPTEIAKR